MQNLVEWCDENCLLQQDQGIGDRLPEECLKTRPSTDQRRASRDRAPLQVPGHLSRRQAWLDRELGDAAQKKGEPASALLQEAQIISR